MNTMSRMIKGGILLVGVILWSCGPKYQVERMIKRELNSGVRNDSLFVGVTFGMPRQDFYDHCWEINRKGIVKEGPENMSVLYKFDHGDYKIDLNFYPDFKENIASKYKCTFSYEAWAPWNKQLQSDKLMAVLPGILENWYPGNHFIKQEREGRDFFYKVDGNRMIELYVRDERRITAIFTDLSAFVDN